MTFDDSLQRLFASSPDDFEAIKEVRTLWSDILSGDLNRLDAFYQLYFDTIEQLVARAPGSPSAADGLSDLQAYQFIDAFASNFYLKRHGTEAAHYRLLAQHAHHLDLIGCVLAMEDFRITGRHLNGNTGCLSDIAAAMVELYFWHTASGPQTDRLRSEVAPLIPKLFRVFPDQESHIVAGLLEHHPDAVKEFVALMRFHLLDRGTPKSGPMEGISIDMLGLHARREQFLHKNGAKILAGVISDIRSWPPQAVAAFVDHCILSPLQVDPIPQALAAQSVEKSIKAYRRLLEQPDTTSEYGISAETRRGWHREGLARAEAELALIESDFDEWNARRRRQAAERIATSITTKKILTAVVGKLPDDQRPRVQDLLDAAQSGKKPKRFPIPKPSDNTFKDFGFKLLVIEELMYVQEVLKPKFDVNEFAGEYEGREISVEDDGYEIIPEVQDYFTNLAIPGELLSRVETLHQSSGLDGGSEFINHLWRFWDPGCGDEPIPVGPEAVHDLALLPNLRRISGLENSNPGAGLLNALKERGIELLSEESVSFAD